VFENKVLRIFGRKREEVVGGRRRLHKEELHNLYASSNIIRVIKLWRMRLAGNVARMGGIGNACNSLVGKCEGKRPVGRPRHRWDINIRMDL
jgi:hypothetical protein